jgi:hypothetical protein
MTSVELEIQKKAVIVFEELRTGLPKISSKVTGLGWKQRNELITHVYSNYNNHEKLNEAKSRWENLQTQMKALDWLYNLFVKHRDLYGYFDNYSLIIKELDEVIEIAVHKEYFEIAEILSQWRMKLPNPLQ